MQKIKILLISFAIIVTLMAKTQINGKHLSSKNQTNVVVKPMRLRTFTPLKGLKLFYEVQRKLQEEKEAEEARRKNAKDMEEQTKKSSIIQKYLYSPLFGSQSFWNDFHINRSF
jgi:hypothetical protein